MGRTVTLESESEKILKSLGSAGRPSNTALLIGYTAAGSRDFVFAVLPTPECKEEGDNDWWVSEHATQVTSSLPGGIWVLGLAVSCSSAELKSLRIRKLLKDVWKSSHLGVDAMLGTDNNDALLMHYCSQTKQVKCQAVDTSNYQTSFHPVNLKFQPHSQPLVRLVSCIKLKQQVMLCKSTDRKSGIGQCIKKGLAPIVQSVTDCIAMIDGHVVSESQTLLKNNRRGYITVELLMRPLPLHYDTPPSPCKQQDGSQFTINGEMLCMAYVTDKCTSGEAIKALKQDILRSLHVRENLIIDELGSIDTKQPGGQELVVKLPRRFMVSFVPRRFPFLLSDYCFPDEHLKEVAMRLKELWNVDLTPENISLDSAENEPSNRTALPASLPSSSESSAQSPIPPPKPKPLSYLVIVAVAVAIVSILISLFIFITK